MEVSLPPSGSEEQKKGKKGKVKKKEVDNKKKVHLKKRRCSTRPDPEGRRICWGNRIELTSLQVIHPYPTMYEGVGGCIFQWRAERWPDFQRKLA